MINHVIWDWNGTLIDDVDLCVDVLNQALASHKKSTISVTVQRIILFPVSEFYRLLNLPIKE